MSFYLSRAPGEPVRERIGIDLKHLAQGAGRLSEPFPDKYDEFVIEVQCTGLTKKPDKAMGIAFLHEHQPGDVEGAWLPRNEPTLAHISSSSITTVLIAHPWGNPHHNKTFHIGIINTAALSFTGGAIWGVILPTIIATPLPIGGPEG